jgi:hypothetical protein
METKGAGKLKVVGILFIIFGAISAVVYALALAGGGVLVGFGSSVEGDAVKGGVALMIGSAIYLVWAVIQLVTGILGVKNCKVPEKAKTLFTLSAVLIVFSIVSNVLSMILNGIATGNIIGLVGGCILPIIFMLGAKENMDAR